MPVTLSDRTSAVVFVPEVLETANCNLAVGELVPIPTLPEESSVKLVAGALPEKLYAVPLVPPDNVPVALSVVKLPGSGVLAPMMTLLI